MVTLLRRKLIENQRTIPKIDLVFLLCWNSLRNNVGENKLFFLKKNSEEENAIDISIYY